MNKIIKCISIFVLAINCVLGETETDNILFVGNSFTYKNNMPKMFEKISNELGENVNVETHTSSGAMWRDHNRSNELFEKINSKHWKSIVLQEQSMIFSLPFYMYDQLSLPVLKDIDKKIETTDEIVLFQTWGYKNGNLHGEKDDDYYKMQQRIINGYEDALKVITHNNKTIANVGEIWSESLDLNINLYSKDEKHPGETGSFLTACVFYSEIYKKEIEKFNYKPRKVKKSDKRKIINLINNI